jgi:hypothetical protein
MSIRNYVRLGLTLLCLLGLGCSEEKAPAPHVHAEDGSCCAFHAKKEVAEPKRYDLGKADMSGLGLSAMQVGEVKAGEWALIQIKTEKLLSESAKVKVWIGDENATQKTAAEYCEGHDEWDAEVSVPKTIAPGMKWWIEVDQKKDPKGTTSFAIKP